MLLITLWEKQKRIISERTCLGRQSPARLLEERKVTGVDFSDALEAELAELGRKCGALGENGTLADLLA